jgi:hypothetical protein
MAAGWWHEREQADRGWWLLARTRHRTAPDTPRTGVAKAAAALPGLAASCLSPIHVRVVFNESAGRWGAADRTVEQTHGQARNAGELPPARYLYVMLWCIRELVLHVGAASRSLLSTYNCPCRADRAKRLW